MDYIPWTAQTSLAQARRDDPERVKREFKQAWDEITNRPEFQAAWKRLSDAGDAEEKLRRLLKGFVSFDDPYSMDVLEVYTQKHFQCSAKQFVWNTHVIDSCAHLDVQLSDPALVLAEELRKARSSTNTTGQVVAKPRKIFDKHTARVEKVERYRKANRLGIESLATEIGVSRTITHLWQSAKRGKKHLKEATRALIDAFVEILEI